MIRRVNLFFFVFLATVSFSQQLILNEVSQGAAGANEYVEFVVVGTPTCIAPVPCVDLRSVIIDDNNGYFASGGGTGIASGAVRFGNIAFWQCVPQGTIILIYNSSSVNPSIPADDVSLTDGNCSLIIPSSSNLLERTTVSPTVSITSYPSNASWVSGGSWDPLAMSNSDDSFQLPNSITGLPNHAVSWGNNTNGSIIYFSGGAGSKVFSFMNTISNDWNEQGNWLSASVTNASSETPGAANNSQNSSWIGSMNPQCGINNGLALTLSSSNESCLNACDGVASVNVTGGQSPYTYLWSNSATTSNIANLCPGNYTIVVTASNGCSATDVVSILSGSSAGSATINPAGPFTTIDTPQQINPLNTGGVWSSDCGTCLSATGMFNPQIAGVGSWQICYEIGSGQCADSDCISIIVTTGCLPQTTNETVTICPEDSVLVFGSWEYLAGQYAESNIDINGCDSTHILEISNYSVNPIIENIIVCEFDSVFVFNQWHYESQVLVQNELTVNGCSNSHTVNINLENCELEPSVIYIPNVFTPNGDLINDIFKIEALGGEVEEAYIFNRWGNIIFTFDPSSLSWDGYDQKSGLLVQDGVYSYLVFFKPAYTARERIHGFVTVIR